jgi:hypothetical protein
MRFLSLTPLLLAALIGSNAQATVSINLSGSAENSSAALEKSQVHSVSASVGMNLGSHFMVGLTHRRAYTNRTGLKRGADRLTGEPYYVTFEEREQSVINSVDLTIIPFNGLVSPFVFGGVARRDYFSRSDMLGTRTNNTAVLFPVPNYGGGLAVQLGMGFELKITQTFTPGKETRLMEDGTENSQDVIDTYSQLWLGYKL